MEASPFSITHSWTLHWNRLPSDMKFNSNFNQSSQKEHELLQALATVGVIGGQQMLHLFGIDRKRRQQMEADHKIYRHEIRKGNTIIPIYTLGYNGAVLSGIDVAYTPNYWVELTIEDVLKRILFFRLYQHFIEDERPDVLPVAKPFIGGIQYDGKPIHVYIVRGELEDLMMFFKWKEKGFDGRVIIVTESLKHLDNLKPFLEGVKLRVTTDADLMQKRAYYQDLFYFFEDGEFIRDEVIEEEESIHEGVS